MSHKKFLMLTCLLFSISIVDAQSLTKERIEKLKSSVVRVTIEGSQSTGTGFFISPDGALLTCWHVISPSIIQDSTGLHFKKIFIETNSGQKIEVGIPLFFFKTKPLTCRQCRMISVF